MKRLLLFILFWAPLVQASYVQSGKLNFTTTTSGTCTLASTVTSGDMVAVVMQINGQVPTSVTSTHVTSYTQDQNFTSTGSTHILAYHGVLNAGAASETITVALPSALIGIGCVEYSTTTFDQTSAANTSSSITTTQAVEDIVVGATSSGGGTALGGSYTQRQSIQSGGTTYFVMSDRHVTSTGAYSATPTGSGTVGLTMQSFYGGGAGGVKRLRGAVIQ